MPPDRQPLYAKIAIARKQLPGMDEEAYRALLESEFGARSAKDLRHGQLCRLVDILGRMGANYAAGGKTKKPVHKPHARSDFYEIADDEFGKIKRYIAAVWRKELGYDMTSLDTLVSRMFGADCFAWLRDWKKLKILANHVKERAAARGNPPPASVTGNPVC